MTALAALVDLAALPPTLRTIGSLVSQELTQAEMAKRMGISEAGVSKLVAELRVAIVEQARSRAEELPEAVRERLRTFGTA